MVCACSSTLKVEVLNLNSLLVELSTKTYYGGMPTEPEWLDPREDRAWRAFMHAHHQLAVCLNRLLLQDSGLTEADDQILAVLSEHPAGRMPAQELYTLLQWEKSLCLPPGPAHASARADHLRAQPRRRPQRHDPPPARRAPRHRGRSAQHVHNVRRHFIDLLTPAELDIFAALNERILRHLAKEPSPVNPLPTSPRSRTEGVTALCAVASTAGRVRCRRALPDCAAIPGRWPEIPAVRLPVFRPGTPPSEQRAGNCWAASGRWAPSWPVLRAGRRRPARQSRRRPQDS